MRRGVEELSLGSLQDVGPSLAIVVAYSLYMEMERGQTTVGPQAS